MKPNPILSLLLAIVGFASPLSRGEDSVGSPTAGVAPAPPRPPAIASISRINGTSVFFLDTSGRIGAATFSPELRLLNWQHYSGIAFGEARHLAVGRNLSVVTGSPNELTQAFDLDEDGQLDIFQDVLTDWPGRESGATISCGPVPDPSGRLLFAVAPGPNADGEAARLPSTLYSWSPDEEPIPLATSSLPIVEMTVSQRGTFAAWIQLESYREGYYITFGELPPFDPEDPGAAPEEPLALLPAMIVPASLTDYKPIGRLCFITEDGVEKLLVACPEAKRVIEMIPRKGANGWRGPVAVRRIFDRAVFALEEMEMDRVLVGGAGGFAPLDDGADPFRFREVRVVSNGVEVEFSRPVDREKAIAADTGIDLTLIPLKGEVGEVEPAPAIVESDGRTIVLPLPEVPAQAILKLEAPDLVSEEGDLLLFPTFFYTLN